MNKKEKTNIKKWGKLKKVLLIFLGVIVALVSGFLALVYIPNHFLHKHRQKGH